MMNRIYTYFVTSAPGGATRNALRCKLAENSDRDYLVCLKKSSIDVYSLEQIGADDGDCRDSNAPVLTATVEGHTILVDILEFRPPGATQSHLLVLTSNFLLILLTFDAKHSRFVSRPLVSLQEPGAPNIESEVILRVDPEYYLIFFHGQKKTIKCVILDRYDYFNINYVVTMRTGQTMFHDIAFYDICEKTAGPSSHKSSSTVQRAMNVAALSAPCRTDIHQGKYVLECKMLLLASSGITDDSSDSERSDLCYCGLRLFFEIERFDGRRHFTSYGCLPLFPEVVVLPRHLTKFMPLKLNPGPRHSDSLMLLGSQGLGFVSFRDPKNVRQFHVDISVGHISCYCSVVDNWRYIIGDDTGALYLLELIGSSMSVSSALKRRAGASQSSAPTSKAVAATTCNGIVDIVTTKLGVYSPPSALVMLNPNLVYIAATVGNCRTVRLSGIDDRHGIGMQLTPMDCDNPRRVDAIDDSSRILSINDATTQDRLQANDACSDPTEEEYHTMDEADDEGFQDPWSPKTWETWKQTNLGPIVDFTFGPQSDSGAIPILACCGYGAEGRVCSITNGVAIDVMASSPASGVLYTTALPLFNEANNNFMICTSYFNRTRFYKVVVPPAPKRDPSKTAIDFVKQPLWVVTSMDPSSHRFVEHMRTLLMVPYGTQMVLQVTTNGISLVNYKSVAIPRVDHSLNDICKIAGIAVGSGVMPISIVSCHLCDSGVFIGLSNHVFLILDVSNGVKILHKSVLPKQVSSTAYLSGGDFKTKRRTGLIAVSTWEDTEISLISPEGLQMLHTTKVPCGYGVAIRAVRFGVVGDVALVFAALSDGTLCVYRLKFGDCDKDGLGTNTQLSMVMENVIKVSNGPIGLDAISMHASVPGSGGTNLLKNRIVTTGDNPMLIYANRGKLEYVPVNVPRIDTVTSFNFVEKNPQGVSLVFTDKKSIHIGHMDTALQLHVETICSGRSFETICYHDESDLVVVGCNGELIADCDMPSISDSSVTHNDSSVFRCMDVASCGTIPGVYVLKSCVKFIHLGTKEVVHTLNMPQRHVITSMCTVKFDGPKTLIALGSSLIQDKDGVPSQGYIFLVDVIKSDAHKWNVVFLRTLNFIDKGVTQMTPCINQLVVALNETVAVLSLVRGADPEPSDTLRSYKMEVLHESDESYGQYTLVTRAEYKSCSYVVSLDAYQDVIVIGDLMNSMRMLQWQGTELREVCKDFNSVYCTAAAAIDQTSCVVADSSGNFYVFAKRQVVTNDAEAIKAEDVGLFHHGELINRIRRNPKVQSRVALLNGNSDHDMPEFPMKTYCNRPFCCVQGDVSAAISHSSCNDLVRGLAKPNKFWKYGFKTILTCVTTSGSLLQLCIFDDTKLFCRLAFVEEGINRIQPQAGNISNEHWRSFKNRWMMCAAKGFIDGDAIESYNRLDTSLKSEVYNMVSKTDAHGLFYSPELLSLEVEHIQRLRQ
ncbi:CPSF A subunit region family protein [Babesia bovis T2Bo]|uniref:Cleavage/polyadenylation specificity factor A subunit C-terminal domain-containing protein n=1 Tax=Babesia bovis TaxID=5865 RepID=A7AQP3_BABBO|nr:CPSF A subunit region family protein [Babesia bovis T2Bo]EDO06862.1 CPSF A subunit region family protein [Babesia bovis T2Bo]|eukprot:XP_001610430.1 hypothetical protein [Babesia bovis T2Bo]